ncbi:MAG TPA: endonuclease/exonuclease/phosphatase family protein [Gemmataceae bacterium]|jgi:endonuclease/exonuclease/phosphatase family metal-dependent hydrolase|nr:endonuclease/exonuclease/phosphatase family protein [Gemmataceae bacterium]
MPLRLLLTPLVLLTPIAIRADDPATLRVLSYNVHHGEGTDGKLDLARIAKVITTAKPDLVALQEIDRGAKRTGGVDQAAELARLTGLHVEFGKAIDLQGGAYGLATLSRYPLHGARVHPLPGKKGQEARIVLEARVEVGAGRAITFLNTHFQHDDAATRAEQAAKVSDLFAGADGPVVLAGDLNATPESEPMKALAKHWTPATPFDRGLKTIPAGAPKSQIDYVLVRPAGRFKVVEATVIEEKVASDHRPVLAVLEWVGK